jgi:hypothetical protein
MKPSAITFVTVQDFEPSVSRMWLEVLYKSELIDALSDTNLFTNFQTVSEIGFATDQKQTKKLYLLMQFPS